MRAFRKPPLSPRCSLVVHWCCQRVPAAVMTEAQQQHRSPRNEQAHHYPSAAAPQLSIMDRDPPTPLPGRPMSSSHARAVAAARQGSLGLNVHHSTIVVVAAPTAAAGAPVAFTAAPATAAAAAASVAGRDIIGAVKHEDHEMTTVTSSTMTTPEPTGRGLGSHSVAAFDDNIVSSNGLMQPSPRQPHGGTQALPPSAAVYASTTSPMMTPMAGIAISTSGIPLTGGSVLGGRPSPKSVPLGVNLPQAVVVHARQSIGPSARYRDSSPAHTTRPATAGATLSSSAASHNSVVALNVSGYGSSASAGVMRSPQHVVDGYIPTVSDKAMEKDIPSDGAVDSMEASRVFGGDNGERLPALVVEEDSSGEKKAEMATLAPADLPNLAQIVHRCALLPCRCGDLLVSPRVSVWSTGSTIACACFDTCSSLVASISARRIVTNGICDLSYGYARYCASSTFSLIRRAIATGCSISRSWDCMVGKGRIVSFSCRYRADALFVWWPHVSWQSGCHLRITCGPPICTAQCYSFSERSHAFSHRCAMVCIVLRVIGRR